MTPKIAGGPVEECCMSLNFKARSRMAANCRHELSMRIVVAGMSREVCEACGRVSLGYVENHRRTEPIPSEALSSSATTVGSASTD
jgi:hypothetical protein